MVAQGDKLKTMTREEIEQLATGWTPPVGSSSNGNATASGSGSAPSSSKAPAKTKSTKVRLRIHHQSHARLNSLPDFYLGATVLPGEQQCGGFEQVHDHAQGRDFEYGPGQTQGDQLQGR